jgi:ribulose-phosphate 3-epimerase
MHLMIIEPEKYIKVFANLGANHLTIHYETCPNLIQTLRLIKVEGMKAGVAINPNTEVEVLENYIQDIDIVIIMSVYPGFGGQEFIENTYTKIEKLKKLIHKKNATTLIEIDGGVSLKNANKLIVAGADILVAGSAIFNSENPIETINSFKFINSEK